MTWWTYVQRVAGEASAREIARRTGIGQTSVNRWQIASPKPENVRAFANAYGRSVVEAMLAAEILTRDDVTVTEVQADLGEIETDLLLAEIRRRIPS